MSVYTYTQLANELCMTNSSACHRPYSSPHLTSNPFAVRSPPHSIRQATSTPVSVPAGAKFNSNLCYRCQCPNSCLLMNANDAMCQPISKKPFTVHRPCANTFTLFDFCSRRVYLMKKSSVITLTCSALSLFGPSLSHYTQDCCLLATVNTVELHISQLMP